MATTAEIRSEAQSVMNEAGGELTTRAAILLGAADTIDELEAKLRELGVELPLPDISDPILF